MRHFLWQLMSSFSSHFSHVYISSFTGRKYWPKSLLAHMFFHVVYIKYAKHIHCTHHSMNQGGIQQFCIEIHGPTHQCGTQTHAGARTQVHLNACTHTNTRRRTYTGVSDRVYTQAHAGARTQVHLTACTCFGRMQTASDQNKLSKYNDVSICSPQDTGSCPDILTNQ